MATKRKPKAIDPLRPRSPALTKTISLLTHLLGDGLPRDSKEIVAYLNEHGSSRRYLYTARKMCNINLSKRPDGSAIYQMNAQLAADEHPQLARSSEILSMKSPLANQTVREKLADQVPGYDPVVALAQIGSDLTVPLSIRLEIHQTLLKYIVPQVKAADITVQDQPIALEFKWQQ